MALINCTECGAEMSDKAKSCPKCGCPNSFFTEKFNTEQPPINKKESVLGIVGAFLSFIIFSFPLEFFAFILCLFSLRKKDKKQSCATFGLILSVLTMLFHIFILDSDVNNSKENINNKPVSATQNNTKNEVKNDGIINVTFDECTLKYLRHEILKNATGDDCVAVFYEFTNNSDESTACIYKFSDIAFQNGVELDTSLFLLEDYDNNDTKEIKPGVSIEVYSLFKHKDMSNIELEVSQFASFDNEPLDTMILSLE